MSEQKRDYIKQRDADLIAEMETIRVRNNTNWMDILRVALREAPSETRALIKDISECDSRVRNILLKLAEE